MSSSLSFFDPVSPEESTRVKLCGFTDSGEAAQAIELGANAIGINFWPRSKRFISLDAALPWLSELDGLVTRIGVFVNAEDRDVMVALDSGAIDAAQLHGNESPEQVKRILDQGYRAFKALGVKDRAMLDATASYPGDTLLLDAWAPVDFGGTGEKMDWALGREAVVRWPERHIILAGGLKPDNVADAIRQVKPFAVDVASGIESGTPGRKEAGLMEAFLEAVREIG